MNSLQNIGVVRDRGQITIPDEIRKAISWVDTSSVVSISLDDPERIVIRPHKREQVDWDHLWRMIEFSRSIKGKKGSMSEFIAKDRENH